MHNRASLSDIAPLLICPRCQSPLLRKSDHFSCSSAACAYAKDKRFGFAGSHPMLVDFDESILDEAQTLATGGASLLPRPNTPGVLRGILRKILFPVNAVAVREGAHLLRLVKQMSAKPRVLVVGGGSIGSGLEAVYRDEQIELIAFDVYACPLTQFIADAHRIPLQSESMDAVIIQAVFEHVLDPWQVAREIHRVLRKDGLIYAETPFLQHVHEGAYDFTRFTESGHRYLLREFTHLRSGVVRGPGTQMVWTIDYVARSVFRSVRMGLIIRSFFFWMRYLDRVASKTFAVDGATGFFFMGRKSDRRVQPKEMVPYYQGAQVHG